MKIKATYKPVSGRRSVSVDGVEFVNGISRTVEVSKTGLAIIKKAAADGWFTIEQEWDEKGNIVTGTPKTAKAPVEEAPVEEAPVEEAPVEEAPVEEAPVEEAPVEEAPDFSSMTKTELLAYAEENGFEVNSSMTKAEIITVITGE